MNNFSQKKQKIQIIILSRNRVNTLARAIESALNQNEVNADIKILVSDNSTNNVVQEFVKTKYAEVDYKRRCPPTNVWEHYRQVIMNANGDYVVLFHDDDVLLPNYCEEIMSGFARFESASAIGCNAIKVNVTGEKLGLFHTHCTEKVITEEKWFLSQYIPQGNPEKGIAPFPSYCYKREALKIDHIDERNGPCGDVSFVAAKLRYGPIIWLSKPLMEYTVHMNSDSASLTPDDYRKLWRYMIARGMDKHSMEFNHWRISIWSSWYLNRVKKNHVAIIPKNWREVIVHRLILRNRIKRPSRLLLRLALGYAIYVIMKPLKKSVSRN